MIGWKYILDVINHCSPDIYLGKEKCYIAIYELPIWLFFLGLHERKIDKCTFLKVGLHADLLVDLKIAQVPFWNASEIVD